jgi:hypothetical protein
MEALPQQQQQQQQQEEEEEEEEGQPSVAAAVLGHPLDEPHGSKMRSLLSVSSGCT